METSEYFDSNAALNSVGQTCAIGISHAISAVDLLLLLLPFVLGIVFAVIDLRATFLKDSSAQLRTERLNLSKVITSIEMRLGVACNLVVITAYQINIVSAFSACSTSPLSFSGTSLGGTVATRLFYVTVGFLPLAVAIITTTFRRELWTLGLLAISGGGFAFAGSREIASLEVPGFVATSPSAIALLIVFLYCPQLRMRSHRSCFVSQPSAPLVRS